MSVIIRTAVRLSAGAKLKYDPPLIGEAQQFFDRYRDKTACFVGYTEEPIGPLDFRGRTPGIYVNQKAISVRFDGEEAVHKGLNIQHFILTDEDSSRAKNVGVHDKDERLGDLPIAPAFYPDDTVKIIGKPGLSETPRKVQDVVVNEPFTHDAVPRFFVFETEKEHEDRMASVEKSGGFIASINARGGDWRQHNVPVEELELVERGNVWALYNDPSKLSFSSDQEELHFWSRPGVSASCEQNEADLNEALRAVENGTADLFILRQAKEHPKDPDVYLLRRLHECFEDYREQVRTFSIRFWQEARKESA